MNEIPIHVKGIGEGRNITSDIANAQRGWLEASIRIRERDRSTRLFSEQQRRRLRETEKLTNIYLKDKLERLSIDTTHIDGIPRTAYVAHSLPGAGGHYEPLTGIPVVVVHPVETADDYEQEIPRARWREMLHEKPDELLSATSSVHERIHAATRNQRVWFDYGHLDLRGEPLVIPQLGLESVVNGVIYGQGLENGLTLLDESDVFHAYLRFLYFPQYYREMSLGLKLAHDPEFYRENLLYMPATVDQIAFQTEARLHPHGERDSLVWKSELQGLGMPFRQMRLAEEICVVLGKAVASRENDRGTLFQMGRDLFDRDRFQEGSRQGIQALVDVFGVDSQKILLLDDKGVLFGSDLRRLAADHYENWYIDEVMEIVRNKKVAMGLEW